MRLKAILLASAILLPANLGAIEERAFENVPKFRYQSNPFTLGDTAAEEAAFIQCSDQMTETHRLLVRRGVDIILEDSGCILGHDEDAGWFSGTIHFLN